jgi:hypothetical protein
MAEAVQGHCTNGFWDSGTIPPDFRARHDLFESLINDSIATFTASYQLGEQTRDPILLFINMMWHTIALLLWQTGPHISSMVIDGFGTSQVTQKMENSRLELLRLMRYLAESTVWKVRLKLPSLLFQ